MAFVILTYRHILRLGIALCSAGCLFLAYHSGVAYAANSAAVFSKTDTANLAQAIASSETSLPQFSTQAQSVSVASTSTAMASPTTTVSASSSPVLSTVDFAALAQKCAPAVAFDTLSAIVKTESSFHPLAIAVVGGASYYPSSRDEATKLIASLERQEVSFSVGLGQINSQNFTHFKLKANDLLDPCTNLQVTAQVLGACYTHALKRGSATALQDAISCYYSGNSQSLDYVQRVLANSPAQDQQMPLVPSLQELKQNQSPTLLQPQQQLQEAKDQPLIQDATTAPKGQLLL